VAVDFDGATPSTITVSGQGVTWSQDQANNNVGATLFGYVYHAYNIPGATGAISVSNGATVNIICINGAEYSGMGTTPSALNVVATNGTSIAVSVGPTGSVGGTIMLFNPVHVHRGNVTVVGTLASITGGFGLAVDNTASNTTSATSVRLSLLDQIITTGATTFTMTCSVGTPNTTIDWLAQITVYSSVSTQALPMIARSGPFIPGHPALGINSLSSFAPPTVVAITVAGNLFRPPLITGTGTGGPFFQNPVT
jgi:hypothetical protein